ncbi:MAG: SDR family NAD(P)-dependent oxidoreductase [Pirellulaceae bacterium]
MECSKSIEPIAIVGMACRFPGGFDDLQKLWNGLKNKISGISGTPSNRWSADRYYSTNEVSKGKTYVRRGGYLHQDPRTFDASFFGISPRDAENMDPQQRLILEIVWEAFENAGLDLPSHAKKSVGVYVGGFMLDHMITQMAATNRSQINQHSAAGMMMTMLSNRISHVFDFRGPSLSIDTACSSSLVAFHYGCQDIWNGACEMAVVGGVNVMMRPEYPMGMCKGQFLSRDGECKSFDSRGDGYGRAEGAGAVLLKPLSKAIANGDDILATVIGTGTNQDGHTPGISMPSGEAQQKLIESVCSKYAIDPSTIDYVECHGTGTAIGDPTEAKAIGATYGKSREAGKPVIIGSIKSNIGHMEAGAGVAGVIKAVLTLVNRQTTPLQNLITPNPEIKFDELNIRLSDENISLGHSTDDSLRVAVNSFGYGGSNAHAILQSAPISSDTTDSANDTSQNKSLPESLFIPISGRSDEAVRSLAQSYSQLIGNGSAPDDVAFSITQRRAMLNHRGMVVGQSTEQVVERLTKLANGEAAEGTVLGQTPFQFNPEPVFVFTGMGPQWWGMGQQLYRENPIYRAAVDEADNLFREIAGFSALEQMLKSEEDSQITKTEYAQPANFLIQIGILAVLRDLGIQPGACVGHSVGELGSAYAAGVLSLRDAVTVCFHRSQLQARARGAGSMIAVALTEEQALTRLAETNGRVSIAAINGATNITLAGDHEDVQKIAADLTEQGIFNRILDVEVPYHSPAMDPLMGELAEALKDVSPSLPSVPLYSTVTGKAVDDIAFGSDYWPKNIRQPVEFLRAIQQIIDDGYSIFLEVGPHPVLATSLKECIKSSGQDCRTAFTLRRNTAETPAIENAVMELFANGATLDWNRLIPRGKVVALPNYPWQREMHWLENPRAEQDRINPVIHPILGTQEAPGTPAWRNDFDHEPVAYLRDHVVMDLPILPGAAYVETAMELASIQFPHSKGLAVRDFEIHAPLILKDDRGIDFVTSFEPTNNRLTIRSQENGKLGTGQINVTAEIGAIASEDQTIDLQQLATEFGNAQDVKSFYEQLHRIGLQYGPRFQAVTSVALSETGDRILSQLELPKGLDGQFEKYKIHPSLLDGCFQTLMGMLDLNESTYLPTTINEIRLFAERVPSRIWCLGTLTEKNSRFVECDLMLMDEDGKVVATVQRLRAMAAAKRERVDQWGDPVKLQIVNYFWNAGEQLAEPRRLGNWMIVGNQTPVADEIATQLMNFGARIVANVSLGNALSIDSENMVVPPESINDWKQILESVEELDGVVFAHTLAATQTSNDPTGEHALRALVTATQALAGETLTRKPRVYCLTQNAFQVIPTDTQLNPAQSTFNGFARVAFNELEDINFTTIDLQSNINNAVCEATVQELICDASEDEVAIRDSARFVSELMLNDSLDVDRTTVGFADENHPIMLRPVTSDADVGTVRVLAAPYQNLNSDEVRIAIEKCVVPMEFISGDPENILERPPMEFVGRILEVGDEVTDINSGDRVCGIAPAEATNQLVCQRSNVTLASLNDQHDASSIVASIGLAARSSAAVSGLEIETNSIAVVQGNALGLLIAQRIQATGAKILYVASNEDEERLVRDAGFECVPATASELERALFEQFGTKCYSTLAASLEFWSSQMGFGILSSGGVLIDTNDDVVNIPLPAKVGEVRRTSLKLLASRPAVLQSALSQAINQIESGRYTNNATFEIALADIAWQKLPINDDLGSIVISFETENLDLPIIQRDDLQLDSNGTFLITGGFGGFGQQTARWLVENGARHLVLTGRSGADTTEKQAFVAELEQLGVSVVSAACDASNREQVRALLDSISKTPHPLKGVVHSAAAILDQPIPEIDLKTLSMVMQNKAMGAWILHEETRDLPLALFVLYSSAANLVGNSRQSIYSAANGFLNGLAHFRRQTGLPATSINWGAIADVGIVARDEKLEQFLRYVGLRGMTSREALSLLKKGLARNLTQFGATIIKSWAEWGRFEVRAGKSPRYQRLIASDSQQSESNARQTLIAELQQLSPDDQLELLIVLMTELIAGVLKIDSEQIARSRPISELGVDSLMATEIQMLLESKLGLNIAVLELIGDSTIFSLAKNSLATLNVGVATVNA